jgi:hypothetical protein
MLGKAFISFNRASHRNECYSRYKRTGFFYKNFGFGENTIEEFLIEVGGKTFKLVPTIAPEPNDVIWTNMKVSSLSQFLRSLGSTVVLFVIICVGVWFIYQIKTDKTIQLEG